MNNNRDCLFCLETGHKNKLEDLANKENIFTSHIILAMIDVLLSRYWFQEKISMGIVTSNSLLPVTTSLVENDGFLTLCRNLANKLNNINETFRENTSSHEQSEYSEPDACNVIFTDCDEQTEMGTILKWSQDKIVFFISYKNNQIQIRVKNEIKARFFPEFELFINHFITFLNVILVDPLTPIHEIEIISGREKDTLIHQFNDTHVGRDETCLVQMFQKIVDKYPRNDMIVFGGQRISYEFINKKSNQLARYLRETLRVRPGVIVALHTDVSVEMVIGIFGILKSGGIYLPLSPDNPEERNELITHESKAKIILQNSKHNVCFHDKTVLDISLGYEDIYTGDDSNVEVIHQSSDIAYIIYTSGTSGKPKGVMIKHGGIANSLLWRINEYGFTTSDTILQLFSHVFDGFITSFFTPVLSGATLILTNKEQITDPGFMTETLRLNRVTSFLCIPPLFQAIQELMDVEIAKNIRCITLAGDQVDKKSIENFNKKYPWIEIINEYGPTENSVVSTIKRNLQDDEVVTIGKPIANTRVFILNQKGKLVPVGAPGEICLSGRGLSPGYLNRPDLNEKYFVPNSYIDNEPMYKTGDLGRWRFDGNIEFLGRLDFQVKIRGFRIELNEIENSILQHPKIDEVVVVASGKSSQNRYLCAFYKNKNNEDASNLQDWLKTKLPDYMIPSFFMQMSTFPLTDTGKTDRKKLVETGNDFVTNKNTEKPLTGIESQICEIWKQLLKTDRIGTDDDFFSLGGDSISIIQMQVAVEKLFNIRLSVKKPEEYSTIRSLSGIVGNILKKAPKESSC